MEKRKNNRAITVLTCTVCLLAAFFVIQPPAAAAPVEITVDNTDGTPVHLLVGKVAKFISAAVIRDAHVVDPEIARVIYNPETMSPNWRFISGLKVGRTQLTIWDEGMNIIGTYEVIVSPDAAGLKKRIYEIFPEEEVAIRSSGEHLTLTGTVSDGMKMTKILAVAETFARGQVINLLQVGGIQQVMLEVRIAEISKSTGSELGINFAWDGDRGFALSMLDSLTTIPAEGWPGNPLLLSNPINAVLGFVAGDNVIVSIDALQEDGLLQILAKPTLIAQSGQSASFLAGGEFPFPVAQSFERFTIEWKPFGIGLNFTPTVLGGDTISLVVSPEVSDLDFTRTISFAGFVVPSIDTRRMSTVVELKDGQSFAIAGLLKDYVRESVRKFPILGDIPILGALFRSTRYQKDETELVVIVTPHLVKPVDGDELPLPTDSFEDPTPFELLMLGMLERWREPGPPGGGYAEGGPERPLAEGDFGYILPQ